MPAIVVRLSLRKTFALGGQRMNDHRTIFDLLRFVERGDERARIVTVNIADVFKTQLTDERARQHCRGNHVFHRLRRVMQSLAN